MKDGKFVVSVAAPVLVSQTENVAVLENTSIEGKQHTLIVE
ncbi:hypothetical protein JMUB7504_27640 [Staphylococcus aureus]